MGFAQWSVALLARGRDGDARGAAGGWIASAPVVTFDDDARPSDVLEIVTFVQPDGPALGRESRWRIHRSDSIGGTTQHVTGPTERYHAILAPPLRFELSEERDARGGARTLDVRSRGSAVTRAIRTRFRDEVANPGRIPPWERESVLAEELEAARTLAEHFPDRGDYRRAAVARARELRALVARATSRELEVAEWPWAWIETTPRSPPLPQECSARSLPAAPAPADRRLAGPSAWQPVPVRDDGSHVRVGEFLEALCRVYGVSSSGWRCAEGVAIDDPRWDELAFGLQRVATGACEVEWSAGDRTVRITLTERAASPLGTDPAPSEPGVWYAITAVGLEGGLVLEATSSDESRMTSFRLLGPEPQRRRAHAALLRALDRRTRNLD